jgi:prevent-host-death family protein
VARPRASTLDMTIDFTPLPMTEFRTRPGEILDRVIDGGESFVIERNGRQKACLVPLSVFLPDVSPARIADELQELEKAGEKPHTTITDDREIAFLFRREINHRELTIVLPHGYPNACPRVYADPLDAKAPHRFSDGALCVFGMMTSWNPAKHTAAFALRTARSWLEHYDVWQRTGIWPTAGVDNAS